jgi:hypothetical protein
MGISDTWATDTGALSDEVSVGVSIVSWLSGVGDFGSMSAPPTTTTTSNTPTTKSPTTTTSKSTSSSPPPPPPPKPSNGVLIELFEIETGSNGFFTWEREWQVYQIAVGSQINPCNAKVLASANADTATGDDPGFPDVDLTFTAWGISGCKYTHKDAKTIGSMSCPGVSGITCLDDRKDASVGCEFGGNVYGSVLCEW